jgi:RNA polymerase sigma-70 factor (ECF subfamily)
MGRGERMRTVVPIVLWLSTVTVVSSAADSKAISVQAMPPVVVQTIPMSGATDVDPSLSEIKVTFSKEMHVTSWSWVQISADTFPDLIGKPYYMEDRRTCVANVKLQPGKTYVIWFNSEDYRNFRDLPGHPAVPYLLVFETSE